MPESGSVYEQLEAEVQCVRCKKIKWIAYEWRQSGQKSVPKGVEVHTGARCMPCPTGEDFCNWTGKMRFKS